MRFIALKLTGIKLALAIVGLVLTGGTGFAATALELKNGSVSRFIATVGRNKTKITSSSENKNPAAGLPVQENQPQAATGTSTQTTNKDTKTKSTPSKTSPSSSSSSSGSSNSGSSSGGTSSTPSNVFGNYSAASVEGIVSALVLVFNDALGDYTNPGGGEPPQGVYGYAPIDQDNVYMGVRDGRLYIKITLGGTVPTARETIGSDTIQSITFNIHFSKSSDPESSNECGGVETSTQINIGYNENGQIFYNPWFSANCNNTEPYQSGHDWRFEKTGNGLAHTYNAGIGKNSLVYSFALSDLIGTINVGDAVKLDISSEAESNNWEHYSYDQNLTQNRRPSWVDWTVTRI